MYDFLKQNRVLALALAGTAVFLLCLVIWLAGMLGDDGTAPTPVAGALQTSESADVPISSTPVSVVKGDVVVPNSAIPGCTRRCPEP